VLLVAGCVQDVEIPNKAEEDDVQQLIESAFSGKLPSAKDKLFQVLVDQEELANRRGATQMKRRKTLSALQNQMMACTGLRR
jgi:hypothetical protein